jgi:carbonic anhydrase/acetyltransferase-like protein (isoleucine patch superfamily)
MNANGGTARLSGLLLPYKGKMPKVAPDAFIAPGAVLIGDVEIGPGASVWYNCVLRGDVNHIRVGEGSNVQDGTIIHVDRDFPTVIGKHCLIGHIAIVHGCTMGDNSFVGMKACVMDGCVIESGAMVAAGALVPPARRILKGQLWAGVPAKYFRDLKPDEAFELIDAPKRYMHYAQEHKQGLAGAE